MLQYRAMHLARINFCRAAPALAILLSICLGACVNVEKQGAASPLVAAELRLARAEKQKLDVNAQGGEYLPRAVFAALPTNSDPREFRPPTSIAGLSPKNPLLIALNKLPINVPHNSIIGDRGRGDTPKSSDGVVPYWSSHLDSAQSELIVPTGHGAMEHPKAVQEIRRILLQQLGVLKAKGQQEKVPKYGASLLPTT
jgi:hypothetical protein